MSIRPKLDFLEPKCVFSEILKMLKILILGHFGEIWAVLRSGCPKNQEKSKIEFLVAIGQIFAPEHDAAKKKMLASRERVEKSILIFFFVTGPMLTATKNGL